MQTTTKSFLLRLLSIFIITICLFVIIATKPSAKFQSGTIVHISKNTSIKEISNNLYKKDIIKSPLFFKISVFLTGGRSGVLAGDYLFHKPQNTIAIAYRMVNGVQGLNRIKITVPEGYTVHEVAYLLLKKIPNFNAPYFVKIAINEEGYLFPDTYYFLQNVTASEVLRTMRGNFDVKIKTLNKKIVDSGRPLSDIIKMASLLEEEARTDESRKIIAGILWKRLSLDMPLQVDATILYFTNREPRFVTFDDTKLDSPYNTYTNKGLPVGPISNPGLNSIISALEPLKTSYLYYLSDKKGEMHYADTFDGHKSNRIKYLN